MKAPDYLTFLAAHIDEQADKGMPGMDFGLTEEDWRVVAWALRYAAALRYAGAPPVEPARGTKVWRWWRP